MSAGIRPEITAIVEKIDALRPQLVAAGRQADADRRLNQEVFDAVAATGAFSISVPTKWGGLGANTREAHAVARAIGRGDGSVAWVGGVLDTGAWLVGLMDEKAQEDVWGPNGGLNDFVSGVLSGQSDSVNVDGGIRVTGKWGYGTGSMNAKWSLLGVPLKNDAGEQIDVALALIPTSELSYEDNWFIAGMRSTASVMQVAEDVFVPSHRLLPLTAAVEGNYVSDQEEGTYHTIFVPSLFMKLIGQLIGPHLGLGRAALDLVIAKADSKSVPYSGYTKQSDSPLFQATVAKAAVQLNAAEAVAAQIADEIYAGLERGHYAPYGECIEMRARAGWVVETVTQVINDLLAAHGSAGFAETSPLQRIWRDQAVAARHGHTLGLTGYDAYGKILFGREDDAKFVLPVV